MNSELVNWKTQIRKGYLELCILLLIQQNERLYGFELLEKLKEEDLSLKEGTVYPMLNRMTADRILRSVWETENIKGHPRKFYSLTQHGSELLDEMVTEFEKIVQIFKGIKKAK